MAKGPQFPVYDIETDRFEMIPLKVIETGPSTPLRESRALLTIGI